MHVVVAVDNRSRGSVSCGRLGAVRVEHVLDRLGGVASAGELRRYSGRGKIRIALARGRIVRDGRGRYSLPGADEALRAANRLSGVLCLDSAARHHGWKLKQPPSRPSVAVPRNRKVSADRRTGVRVLYVALAPDDIDGMATSQLRTVMDCASRMPFDEALTVADSALRSGGVSAAQLVGAAMAMPDRHRARCLRVAQEADARADNPFESVLRAIALGVSGLSVEPQVWVGNSGRSDLGDRSLHLAVEAESFEFHGRRRLLKRDCERYNDFVISGWSVIRFAWEHVMFDPDYVRRVLEGVVGLLTAQPHGRALEPADEQLSA